MKTHADAPTARQVRRARLAAGLTQAEAGALVYAPLRTWQDWEYGQRNMPTAKWELLQAKLADRNA